MIDPSKMDAFLNEGSPAPDESEMADGDEMPEEAAPAPEDPADRFAKLIVCMEENIEDVLDAADEMDADVLLDTDEPMELDDYEIMVDVIGGLDRKLQKVMKESLSGGITMNDADFVAEHLEKVELTDEPEKVAGFLFRAAESYAGPPSDEDEEEEEEETDEEESDEEPPAPEDLLDEV